MLFPRQTVSQSNSPDTSENRTGSPRFDAIPSELLLSLATAPLLVGLRAGQALAQFLQEVGEASEEVFRGDRLPVLNFPTAEAPAGNPAPDPAPDSAADKTDEV